MAQGLAEVVPVSSSAQLALLPWVFGWEPPRDRTTFAAGLHAGSCLGITWALRSELRSLDRRTTELLALTCVPAAVAGALTADRVEARLGRPPQLAALLAGAAAVLWAVDRTAERRPCTPDVGRRAAGVAALAQVVALAPGVSRSGATLTALRACGVERAAAARFSLLMSLPITAGAAALSLGRADSRSLRVLAPAIGVGAGCAAVAGGAAARSQGTGPGRSAAAPALYRLGLAAAVAWRLIRRRKDPL